MQEGAAKKRKDTARKSTSKKPMLMENSQDSSTQMDPELKEIRKTIKKTTKKFVNKLTILVSRQADIIAQRERENQSVQLPRETGLNINRLCPDAVQSANASRPIVQCRPLTVDLTVSAPQHNALQEIDFQSTQFPTYYFNRPEELSPFSPESDDMQESSDTDESRKSTSPDSNRDSSGMLDESQKSNTSSPDINSDDPVDLTVSAPESDDLQELIAQNIPLPSVTDGNMHSRVDLTVSAQPDVLEELITQQLSSVTDPLSSVTDPLSSVTDRNRHSRVDLTVSAPEFDVQEHLPAQNLVLPSATDRNRHSRVARGPPPVEPIVIEDLPAQNVVLPSATDRNRHSRVARAPPLETILIEDTMDSDGGQSASALGQPSYQPFSVARGPPPVEPIVIEDTDDTDEEQTLTMPSHGRKKPHPVEITHKHKKYPY